MGRDIDICGARSHSCLVRGGMSSFISFIYCLQACLFRCHGQGCLEDQADLWEDEVAPGMDPRSKKEGSPGSQRLEGRTWGLGFLSGSHTLLFCFSLPALPRVLPVGPLGGH